MPLDQKADDGAKSLSNDSSPVEAVESSEDSGSSQLTDKLDKLAGGRTISEKAPAIPRGPRGARAAVLQALYEEDLTGHPALRALHRLPAFARLSPAQSERAESLVRFIGKKKTDLDAKIATVAKEYPVSQLGTVDRNVLRIALAELEPGQDLPQAVVVNEAVELAKLFGSDSSPKFVNGVLGALLR